MSKRVNQRIVLDKQTRRRIYRGEFKWFYPTSAPISDELCDGELQLIGLKSRQILATRSDKDIIWIAENIPQLLISICGSMSIRCSGSEITVEFFPVKNIDAKRNSELLDQFRDVDLVLFAAIALKKSYAHEVPPLAQFEHRQIRVDELLATFALVEVARTVRAFRWYLQDIPTAGIYHAMQASEAIAIAPYFNNKKSEKGLQVELRKRAKIASNKRWEKWAPLRDRALEIFLARNVKKSKASIVREMVPEISGMAKKLGLAPSAMNFERTISDWIRRSQR